MLDNWLPFLMYGSFALLIPASMMLMSFVFATRPSRRTRTRTIPFESGVSTGPMQKRRFTISFYLTAMLFILFDIEIVFFYPWAVLVRELGTPGLLEMFTFLAVLGTGYLYLLKRRALEWE